VSPRWGHWSCSSRSASRIVSSSEEPSFSYRLMELAKPTCSSNIRVQMSRRPRRKLRDAQKYGEAAVAAGSPADLGSQHSQSAATGLAQPPVVILPVLMLQCKLLAHSPCKRPNRKVHNPRRGRFRSLPGEQQCLVAFALLPYCHWSCLAQADWLGKTPTIRKCAQLLTSKPRRCSSTSPDHIVTCKAWKLGSGGASRLSPRQHTN
jgi:hypothetical protein